MDGPNLCLYECVCVCVSLLAHAHISAQTLFPHSSYWDASVSALSAPGWEVAEFIQHFTHPPPPLPPLFASTSRESVAGPDEKLRISWEAVASSAPAQRGREIGHSCYVNAGADRGR